MDVAKPPRSLIDPADYPDFVEWARDAGYDESWFNRWDSKSRALEEHYLEETRDPNP